MILTMQLDTEVDADRVLAERFLVLLSNKAPATAPEEASRSAADGAETKRKPGRPRKTAEAADPAPVEAVTVVEPEPAAKEEAPAEEEDPGLTIEAFRAAAIAFAKKHGRERLLAHLQAHGYSNIGAVPDDKLQPVYDDLLAADS